ncbi:MAG: isocitrate lyase/phosphoenolpyruvate mutase family protein [Caldimonas sp.]
MPSPSSLAEKAARFRALHEGPRAFVIANAFDAGSAILLAKAGFEALATSSGAAAGMLGRRDGEITRDEALAHARAIAAATDLPVSADLENGFGETPEHVAETIRLAGETGIVGGSIEDYTGDKARPFYPLDLAVARIEAAVQAARALPFAGFSITARSENYLRGNPDLADTIARLQAYEAAGADVLFAPALPDLETVRTICAALKKPFNFMVGIKGKSWDVATLEAAGVRRISLATSLWRAAMAGARDAAEEVRSKGTFGYLDRL